jgi:S-adenosylmethionine hydrolase
VTRPIIALLTDFGTQDHYVGAMRGVALGICPDATIVDITHEIPPQDVLTGTLELASAYKYFPERTVFLCVVDPGVGSSRRAIAATSGGCVFVAPDNGLLTMVFQEQPPGCVVELTDPRYARPTISRTFEGRDRFAPAAAWLASGTDLRALGPSVADWVTIDVPVPRVNERTLQGEVLRVDRFGNLVTNIDRVTLDRFRAGANIEVAIAGQTVPTLVSTYADAHVGAVTALFGSDDYLEIAVPGGSAAALLGLARGAPVTTTLC